MVLLEPGNLVDNLTASLPLTPLTPALSLALDLFITDTVLPTEPVWMVLESYLGVLGIQSPRRDTKKRYKDISVESQSYNYVPRPQLWVVSDSNAQSRTRALPWH